ncbi:DNA-protecting protein DprA [Phototrophicus methaneseepsis]|uniref:DNA-protecting protein DprA n=1 Tax=Phototrophicus methaneseepsis TaxID=2710758 RepID=A0A7S8E5N7_9CHLR|nr:DNA-processing protein DprA [Phototrophicus methaneseepsis]QPC80852.1 DNA-protecting protein DprA [Phototrophicus methaneseepsis]
MSDRPYWLGFHLIQHIGAVRMLHLKQQFGTLQAAWHAPEHELRHTELPQNALNALLTRRKQIDLNCEIDRIQRLGVHLMTLDDADYPVDLRRIPDPPPVLYIRGHLTEQDSLALAIVGTRRATRYGRDATFTISRQLASRGVTIVSGLALGIDTAAHEGALAANGRTLAILGCGIDITYPRENIELAEKIAQHGAVITEFPVGTPPTGTNFPRRNRILSGLSLGVLVAEAPPQSGALITAETALEQDREVFAIPSNIFNKVGQGSNQLIQEGATLVMNAGDILDALNVAYVRVTTKHETERVAPENDTEKQVLNALETDPIHVDDLIRLTGLPSHEVTATLTLLELKGLAITNGPMQYSRSPG